MEHENSIEKTFAGNSWELSSDIKQVPAMDDEIEQRLIAAGFDEEKAKDLMLGIHEAVLNAMRHGNHEDPEKKVQISLEISDGKVTVEIEDEGEGYDSSAERQVDVTGISGRGLDFYIKPYFDISFNEKGNKITLTSK